MRSWIPLLAMIGLSCVVVAILWWAFHRSSQRHHRAAVATGYQETVSETVLREHYFSSISSSISSTTGTVQKLGETLFIKYCTLCHGVHGQGLIGPNLRDDHWINGSDLKTISQSIANGNPAKGMAPWKPVLSTDELHALVFYVARLSDTADKNGKAPEGTLQPMTWRTHRLP
jgi:cbb3-type cytochrome c oxidase subunit III